MKNFFSSPLWEGIKEPLRWILCYGVSWIIIQILDQITLVPETQVIRIWVFTFTIPLQLALKLTLTMVARFLDKWKFEVSKEETKTKTVRSQPQGIIPF